MNSENAVFGAISEKIRTFDMQINFAMFPPPKKNINFSLLMVVGETSFPFRHLSTVPSLSIIYLRVLWKKLFA